MEQSIKDIIQGHLVDFYQMHPIRSLNILVRKASDQAFVAICTQFPITEQADSMEKALERATRYLVRHVRKCKNASITIPESYSADDYMYAFDHGTPVFVNEFDKMDVHFGGNFHINIRECDDEILSAAKQHQHVSSI